MKLARFLVLCFLTACLAACQPLLARTTSTTQDTDTSQPKGSQIPWTLTYTRSGGFAGISKSVKIDSGGSVLDSQGQEISAPADDVSALVAEINQLDFSSFEDDYSKSSECRDCFTFTLTFEQGGMTKTITMVEDGTTQLPKELQSILQNLTKIAAGG
jgi:hypothetical protein